MGNTSLSAKTRCRSPIFHWHRSTADACPRLCATAQMASFRRIVAELDVALPIYGVRTVEQFLTRSYAGVRMGAVMVGLFAAAALALAAVGLLGVLHHS